MSSVFNILISTVALIALVGPGNSPAVSVYRWLDDEGQVHFSDRAPQGIHTKITDIKSSSGKADSYHGGGLRDTERHLLDLSRRREDRVLQERKDFISKQAAAKSVCRRARTRYDREKRKPDSAKSNLVKRYYEEMREICR